MMKFNKINFGLLMLLFLCRFENILGVSDKNIEEGLKEKYKIFDLDGNILKNEQGEDFSFIVTCEYNRKYYKYSEKIESFIENIKKEEAFDKRLNMENELEKKSGVSFWDNIVKTKDGRVLVVKDKIKNKVYLVFGIYDKDSKTANIFLDKNYKLQTSGPYDIEENNTIHILIEGESNCGGVKFNEEGVYTFQIVCCKLEDVNPDLILRKLGGSSYLGKKKSIEKEDDFVEYSGCCDSLCNWCKNLCP